MSNTIKNTAYQIIKRRRENAAMGLLIVENQLEKDEIYNAINLELATARLSLAKHESGIVRLPKTKVDELKIQKKSAAKKLEEYLKSKDISLEPDYYCKKCQDTGFVQGLGFRGQGLEPSENNLENKKLIPNPYTLTPSYCSCFKHELSKLLMLNSNVSDINKYSLDKIELSKKVQVEQVEALIKIYSVFKTLVNDFPGTERKNLYIAGATGTGKTYSLKAIAKHIIDKGFHVLYVTAFEMNEMFRKYHTTFTDEKQGYIDSLLNPDLLIIDDLGTEIILNNITKEHLYLILNERLESSKHTFVSSNLSGDEARERYGERIFSRLLGKNVAGYIDGFKGIDLRTVK